MAYWHRVESARRVLYDGPDNADAMAAWSEAIAHNLQYVTLESLRSPDEQLRRLENARRDTQTST
jgi:hypothetical protein